MIELIQYIDCNHDATKLGLMEIINSDTELYFGFQIPTEPCVDYMFVFKAVKIWHASILGR